MSRAALGWAFDRDVKPSGTKLALVALAALAGEEGYVKPRPGKLERLTSESARTLRRHLSRLQKLGLIAKVRPRRALYKLALPRPGSETRDA